jgi:hypothetical protein
MSAVCERCGCVLGTRFATLQVPQGLLFRTGLPDQSKPLTETQRYVFCAGCADYAWGQVAARERGRPIRALQLRLPLAPEA